MVRTRAKSQTKIATGTDGDRPWICAHNPTVDGHEHRLKPVRGFDGRSMDAQCVGSCGDGRKWESDYLVFEANRLASVDLEGSLFFSPVVVVVMVAWTTTTTDERRRTKQKRRKKKSRSLTN